MSQLDKFLEAPWKSESLHEKYTKSFVHMSPVPEVATGEVLLASLYRNVGYSGDLSEKQPPIMGRRLTKCLDKRKRPTGSEGAINVEDDLWVQVVTKSITSPKQTNQSKKQFLQLSPFVPDSTIYSMAARLAGNPWNPGRLIAKMLSIGTQSKTQALGLWQDIYEHLSVTEVDDIWAQLIQKELVTWRDKSLVEAWKKPEDLPLKDHELFSELEVLCPAVHFVKDLQIVLSMKCSLTRRQWISLLESLCRIAACSHVMWLCTINNNLSNMLEKALNLGSKFTQEKVKTELDMNECFWALEQTTSKTIEELVRNYIVSRCKTNLILSSLEDIGEIEQGKISLSNLESITDTLNYLAANKELFDYSSYRSELVRILDLEPKITACKKGTSKNIVEFISYVVRQRQTSEAGLETYDQGYYLKKKGGYASAPWVVGLGPASLLLMVHCTVEKINGPATVADLINQLSLYGVEADFQQESNSDFYKLLRSLGLVVESPDAEGGMVVHSPFTSKN